MSSDNVVQLFPDGVPSPSDSEELCVSNEALIAFWKGRNQIISETFSSSSVYQKQVTLDAMITMNNDLYELVLELKVKLKEKGE